MYTSSLQNEIYYGSGGKKSLYDLEIPPHFNQRLLIFIHGYMGFKDWGCWALVQSFFTERNYGFCKYNASHNGVSLDAPTEFVDLDAFSINTYRRELEDLQHILDQLSLKFEKLPEIYLFGHSRGGGIALLSAHDSRITGVITIASIGSIEKRFPQGDELERWKRNSVRYVTNSRTKQEMPHAYEQFLDFQKHKETLRIEQACRALRKPSCIIHGSGDQSVSIEESQDISDWLQNNLIVIEEANHTFGATHPWDSAEMPEHLFKACNYIHSFLLSSCKE